MSADCVGFITPPDWFDPSPSEFPTLVDGGIRTQQTILELPEFDWRIESIAQTESLQQRAARQLAAAGCNLTAITGTPFGWAGLTSIADAHSRDQRLADFSGVPHMSMAAAIFDWLQIHSIKRVGLACTYYSPEWIEAWSASVSAAGFETVCHGFIEDGWMPLEGAMTPEFWTPAGDRIRGSVRNLLESASDVEAVVISGSGSRTLGVIETLRSDHGIPIIGSDTALYRAIARHLKIELNIAL